MTDYALPPTPNGVDEEDWRAAVSAIRGYCGWHIAPVVTETVNVDGSGGGLILLPTLRLLDVTAVTNHGLAVDQADVHWSVRGTVRGPSAWSMARYGDVTMTIQHGYPDFPPEVLAVARSMAQSGIGSVAKKIVSGPHSVDLGDAAQVGAAALSPGHERVLNRYRIRNEL